MPSNDQLVARVAAGQHGLITRAQAIHLGFTPSSIKSRLRAGRWRAFEPGVYLIEGAPYTWHTRMLSVCLASGGVASHRSAAALLGLDGFRFGPPEVTVERGSRFRRSDVRVHQSSDLELVRPILISSIPTTDAARLVVDVGLLVPFEKYELMVHELMRTKGLTWDDALAALVLHARRGRNGVGPLRALLDASYGSLIPESALERVFERLLEDAGLPKPVRQYEIFDYNGVFIARMDFAYPSNWCLIELDSRKYHLNPVSFERDREKRNLARTLGWHVLEITWQMVTSQPATVIRLVRAALDRDLLGTPPPMFRDRAS